MAAAGDGFNCQRCKWGRHCDDDRAWPGSRGAAGFPSFVIRDVIESRICLLPMLTAASRAWLRLHDEWKAGYLPWSGGTLEQPAAFREAMGLIESTLNRIHSEEAKRGR